MNTLRIYAYVGATVLTTILLAGSAQASDKALHLSMDDYIQTALEHSPGAAQILSDGNRREADAIEAGQLANPELQLDVTTLRQKSGQQVDIELEQPLRGSDFGARLGYANAIRSTKNAEQKAQLLDLSHDAARAYLDLWEAQANLDLLETVIRDARRQSKTVTDAAAQGIADKSEADIFTAEASEMELKKTAFTAQRQTFLTTFVRLAGLPMADYRLDKPAFVRLPDKVTTVLAQADSETSIRAILSGRQNVAQRRLSVAQADASFPMISPRAVFSNNSTDKSSSLTLGIHYAIPVWSQNQAEVLRARADVASTDAALRSLDENDFPTVLRAAWQAARDNQAVTKKYESSIVPSWKKIQGLTEKKLGMGQASVFDLWQVRNRLLETQTQALLAQKTALESVLTLENLSGTSFSATPLKGN